MSQFKDPMPDGIGVEASCGTASVHVVHSTVEAEVMVTGTSGDAAVPGRRARVGVAELPHLVGGWAA